MFSHCQLAINSASRVSVLTYHIGIYQEFLMIAGKRHTLKSIGFKEIL